jgi:hypothetical protein
MPYTTEVINNGTGILHIGSGTVSGNDLLTSVSTVLKLIQEGLTPKYGLTDLTNVTEFTVSSSDIERNAALNSEIARLLPSVKLAIVAPTDTIFGMVRMWQAHMDRSTWDAQVFRRHEDALAWLSKEGCLRT